MRTALILLPLLFSAAISAAPQPARIAVGDPSVDGTRLAPYENQWGMHVTKADGSVIQDAGLWKDRLESIDYQGHPCWKRTQEAHFKKQDGSAAGTSLTINIFDRKSLAPFYREYRASQPGQPDRGVRISFADGHMHVEHFGGDSSATYDADAASAFDYDGGLFAVLWSAFPLREGYAASFPSYSEGDKPETVSWHSFRVTGSETIDEVRMGKVRALVVEGDSESGPLRYWLITRPPFVLRMDYKAGNGARWLLDRV